MSRRTLKYTIYDSTCQDLHGFLEQTRPACKIYLQGEGFKEELPLFQFYRNGKLITVYEKNYRMGVSIRTRLDELP
jgi:hypothetical protein